MLSLEVYHPLLLTVTPVGVPHTTVHGAASFLFKRCLIILGHAALSRPVPGHLVFVVHVTTIGVTPKTIGVLVGTSLSSKILVC